MKLQTMLLPTGEFVIVASEVKAPLAALSEAFVNIHSSSGAASVLVADEPIEVVDAIVDENARRADLVADSLRARELQLATLEALNAARGATRERSAGDDDCPCWPGGLNGGPRCSTCPKDSQQPYEPQTGDKVRVRGTSVYGTYVDAVGTIGKTSEHDRVQIILDEPVDGFRSVWFKPGNVEKIDIDSGTVE